MNFLTSVNNTNNFLLWLVAGIILIANLLMAITFIVNFFKDTGKTTENKIRKIAKKEVDEESEKQTATQDRMFKQFRDMLYKAVDDSSKIVAYEIKEMRKDMNKHMQEQKTKNDVLTQGHIELYKKDIRDIYFHLRHTGEITDDEKTYTDKIYQVYKELGGNSDIDAKYQEVCDVYSQITFEKYAKMRQQENIEQQKLDL